MKAWLGLALTGCLLAGCATSKPGWPVTGDPVVDGRAAIEHGPKRDQVLWQYRTALAAMRRGQYAEAAALLDQALARIGGIYGPDASAKQSRRYFTAEAKKTFIGEPYERAMAYYYRGILYWMDGDVDNARACFRSAQFMDSDAEKREYSGDYVLFDYLDGLATAKLNGDGSDAYRRATNEVHLASPPPYDPQANVLFFVESGRGPLKYATGEFSEQLRFRSGQSAAASARIRCDGQDVLVPALDDLTFQAATRGGRVMDHVLANKAVFKQATDTAGNVAILSGAIMAAQQGTHSAVDEVGLGLMLAGLVSKIVSAATTPAADTRGWDHLPQWLGFGAMRLPPGPQTVSVEFLDAAGQPLTGAMRTLAVEVGKAPRDTVVFISDQNP
jgi:hypothetical protein